MQQSSDLQGRAALAETTRRDRPARRRLLLLSAGLVIPLMAGVIVLTRALSPGAEPAEVPYAGAPTYTIALDLEPLRAPADDRSARRAGGLIAVDLDGDEVRDFVLTAPRFVAGYDLEGHERWRHEIDLQVTLKSEYDGLPGTHAPGVQPADVDRDGKTEILFLTRGGELWIIDGQGGQVEWRFEIAAPAGAERWEHLVVADFRGAGQIDLLLQATHAKGYRMGRYLAAYALDRLLADPAAEPLWTRDDFVANAHNGTRVADLDGDGRDEVLGASLVGPDGALLYTIPLLGHIDSIFVADIQPARPGLEVVALEEGGGFFTSDRVFLYDQNGLIWQTDYRRREPQNAAVGDFDPKRAGLEVWCRSRFDEHQAPFTFDAAGELLSHYEMDDVAPPDWTARGVETIAPIHWTGGEKELAAGKERHRNGDVAIFDPISGRFVLRFHETAERLYVVDVTGDWREEIVVWNRDALHIYENPEPNPRPDQPRLWTMAQYPKNKINWNYYNP